MNSYLEQLRVVYDKLQDEVSKEIFLHRSMYSITQNEMYIRQIVNLTMLQFQWIKDIRTKLLEIQENETNLILDGCGHWGGCLLNICKEIKWSCISDKNDKKKNSFNIPMLSRKSAVEKFPNGVFVVTSKVYHNEIKDELVELGVKESNIINFGQIVAENDRQYYDVFSFGPEEIMVDGGCYNCGSIINYLRHANSSYKKIYSFEPENELYHKCAEIVKSNNITNCDVINKGLWNEEKELGFCVRATGGSRIADEGDEIIETCALDKFFEDIEEKPTFIKMDIEGAELEALKGAKEIIQKKSPKLAICVYHKPEDIWEIPKLILKYNFNYKFYLRHYSPYQTETVLYGICE